MCYGIRSMKRAVPLPRKRNWVEGKQRKEGHICFKGCLGLLNLEPMNNHPLKADKSQQIAKGMECSLSCVRSHIQSLALLCSLTPSSTGPNYPHHTRAMPETLSIRTCTTEPSIPRSDHWAPRHARESQIIRTTRPGRGLSLLLRELLLAKV